MKIVWNRSIGWNMSFNGMEKFSPGTFKPMEYTIITDGADCYPWHEVFIWWPRKTITGKKLFWTKAFKRRVWVLWGTGFHMEPETQYATAFDLIAHQDKNLAR
jgi:hypothetical protein